MIIAYRDSSTAVLVRFRAPLQPRCRSRISSASWMFNPPVRILSVNIRSRRHVQVVDVVVAVVESRGPPPSRPRGRRSVSAVARISNPLVPRWRRAAGGARRRNQAVADLGRERILRSIWAPLTACSTPMCREDVGQVGLQPCVESRRNTAPTGQTAPVSRNNTGGDDRWSFVQLVDIACGSVQGLGQRHLGEPALLT